MRLEPNESSKSNSHFHCLYFAHYLVAGTSSSMKLQFLESTNFSGME